MLNIDRALCRDLDTLGFTNVAKLGWSKYKLPTATLAKQCELWLQRQLMLARARARYDHDEQATVDDYQEQLAQCKQLAQEVSARVNHEPQELVPAPRALRHGQATGDDELINNDKNKRTWAEIINGKSQFAYWIHARVGVFVMINTNRDRKITSHEVTGLFKHDVDVDALSKLLVKGKLLTMNMLNDVVKICERNTIEARVSVDQDNNVLPEHDFTVDGRQWQYMQKGSTTWYDCRLRSIVYVSLMVSDDCISDAFVTISGVVRKESTETRAKLTSILDGNPKPSIENLRVIFALFFPNKQATARVAGEDDRHVSFDTLPDTFKVGSILFKRFHGNVRNATYKCEPNYKIEITSYGRVFLYKNDDCFRTFTIDFNVPSSDFKGIMSALAPYFSSVSTARVAGEKDGLVPRSDFSTDSNHWSVQEGESSYLYKTKVAANTWLLVNVELDNRIDSVWLEDALMRQRPSKANNNLHEFLTRGPRPSATYSAFQALVRIARRDRSFDLVTLGALTALEVVQARVDFEKNMIRDVDEMPRVLKVCKGELKWNSDMHAYCGDLASHRNESVHVTVCVGFGSAFRVFLEGNMMVNKQFSLRYPFTHSALVAYIEAELCDVID